MQIIKLGGSVITYKKSVQKPNKKNIAKLCKLLSSEWKKGNRFILIHGAGSFGHSLVLKLDIPQKIKTEKDKVKVTKTSASCAFLSQLIVRELIKNNVPAISLAPSSMIISKNKRILKFNFKQLDFYLEKGVIPVLYGDYTPDILLGFSICSGDQLACFLAKKAERLIFVTDVDGIYVKGKLVKEISKKNFEKIKNFISLSSSPDVTGGMAGKIKEILLAKKPAFIVSSDLKRLSALINGKETICTKIIP